MAGLSTGLCIYGSEGSSGPPHQQRWYYGQTVKYMLHGSEAFCSYISHNYWYESGGSLFQCLLSSSRLHRSVVDDMCDNRVWWRAWVVELYCRRSYGAFLCTNISRPRTIRHNNTHMVAVAYDTTTGCLG